MPNTALTSPLLAYSYWAAEKYPKAFTDVVYGSNKFPETFAAECALGYHAAKGWDAVSCSFASTAGAQCRPSCGTPAAL